MTSSYVTRVCYFPHFLFSVSTVSTVTAVEPCIVSQNRGTMSCSVSSCCCGLGSEFTRSFLWLEEEKKKLVLPPLPSYVTLSD